MSLGTPIQTQFDLPSTGDTVTGCGCGSAGPNRVLTVSAQCSTGGLTAGTINGVAASVTEVPLVGLGSSIYWITAPLDAVSTSATIVLTGSGGSGWFLVF